MRILIDFSQIPVKKMGVGVYALNLIDQLSKIDNKNLYYILIQDDDSCFAHLKGDRLKKIFVPSRIFRKFICRFFLEQVYLPMLLVKNKVDLLHSLHYSFPLFKGNVKKVVTFHDMTFFLVPKNHLPIKKLYFKFFIKICDKFVHKIISVSHSTLTDYSKIKKSNKGNTTVIPLGKTDWSHLDLTDERIELVKKRYGIIGEYLLFIGTIEPRKNLENLISAFEKLLTHEKRYQLVIVGKKGWNYDAVFNQSQKKIVQDKIIFTGYIDENEKPLMIKGAKAFLYPSLYEGFGIPVLEAMSLGIPSITSNNSAMKEVAESAALLIDPQNPNDIYQNILKLLKDPVLYCNLKKKSVRQAKKFSWEKMAYETLIQYYKTMMS